MAKTYLVTGGGGNLGSCMVDIICERNFDNIAKIILFDISFQPESRRHQADVCRDADIDVEWIEGSVTDMSQLQSALNGVNVVFHMACCMDIYNRKDFQLVWNVNVDGTMKVIESCIRNNVEVLVYTSSTHVVGPNSNRDPFINGNEDTEYCDSKIKSPYEETKSQAEKIVLDAHGQTLANNKTLVTCALRPPGIYGGNDQVLKNLILAARSKNIRSVVDPSYLQSRMYIDNVAWSHIVAAHQLQMKEGLGGQAYFIGDETPQMSYPRLNEQFFMHQGYKIIPPEPIVPYWLIISIVYIVNFVSKCFSVFGIKFMQDFLTPFMFQNACTCFTVSHQKFQSTFEYKPLRSWKESRASTRKFIDRVLEENAQKQSCDKKL